MNVTKTGITRLPLVPLRGMVVFPGIVESFDVGRDASRAAVDAAMDGDRDIVVITQKDPSCEVPAAEDLYSIGTVCRIKQVIYLQDDLFRIIVEGTHRCRLMDVIPTEGHYNLGRVRLLYDEQYDDAVVEGHARALMEVFVKYAKDSNRVSQETVHAIANLTDPQQLCDHIAAAVLHTFQQKQQALAILSVTERMDNLQLCLLHEMEVMQVESKVSRRVREQMEQNQREYYLNEQIKAIRSELGEDEQSEIDALRSRLAALPLPEEAREKVRRELVHLENMPSNSPEAPMLHTYLEAVADLPWGKTTPDTLDIAGAKAVLDEDHYGMDKVKERILEYLAVKQLSGSMRGSILCFVGPPGVGKTSIARSIARALGRNFTRMSLGGVHDEAEIRGHRRTYIGAMPGRILAGIKQAGSVNPVFLFDEVDKMGADYRGDPTAAMLEVLDPEQNNTFRDNYMEFPFDLSQVLFVATANTAEGIPAPLYDRMEVIDLESYTDEEKVHIARRHLLDKQLKEHGLQKGQLQVSDDMLRSIIRGYTREAGVRSLERQLAALCRKTARQVAGGKRKQVRVTPANLEKLLGPVRFLPDDPVGLGEVGIATGLAWTEVGGETLSIEVNLMPGDGKLQLTGSLGDVMKESAAAALSYIRAGCAGLGIDGDFYKELDIHIHVPQGATPKDGPSAGITMATALISALRKQPVRRKLAMTGEITLRGTVLPIGGLKEKTMAAYRMGITRVLYPAANAPDVQEIPAVVRSHVELIPVKTMDEVAKYAFEE